MGAQFVADKTEPKNQSGNGFKEQTLEVHTTDADERFHGGGYSCSSFEKYSYYPGYDNTKNRTGPAPVKADVLP